MFVVPTVVPAKLDVPHGKLVAFEHKSLIGATGAEHDEHVIVVVQQLEAVPHAAFVL